MEMTREKLENYRSKKAEIQELQYKINHLGEGDSMVGHSTILNGQYYPPKPETVVGYDYGRYKRLETAYQNRLQKLEQECVEVELWIEEIQDSLTRRIFRMYYIEGMTQQRVAMRVHLDQSRICRKIDNYLKKA